MSETVAGIIRREAARFMAIDGVAGMYEGQTDDGTPCVVIMCERDPSELRERLPAIIEGVPLLAEYSGRIVAF